jgi:UDP-N-acetylmuramoylalanine--D-glutamate ligase
MFENKKILILGMKRSGYEAAKLLAKRNNKIIINDNQKEEQDEEHVKELEDLGVEVILGEHPDGLLTKDFDYLIKNPGIKNDHKYVKLAEEYDIPVINEVELAYALMPKDITLIGITGSNGKTTTTTLIYEMIKASGKSVHLTGNIGFPLAGFVEKIKSGDIVVMEVSIQQLVNLDKFKTNISVLTNIYESHLDFVDGFENYLA